MRIEWRNQTDGQFVEDDDEVGDVETVRVPMYLMDDAAKFRPGYVQLSDEQIAKRRASRDRFIRDLNSAWRMDLRKRDDDDDDDPDDDDNNDNGARPERRRRK
jgi:hypothetical protein